MLIAAILVAPDVRIWKEFVNMRAVSALPMKLTAFFEELMLTLSQADARSIPILKGTPAYLACCRHPH